MRYALVLLFLTLAAGSASAADGSVIHLGLVLSSTFKWVMAAFSVLIGAALVGFAVKGFKYLGVQITDSQRARLQEIVINGLNIAASKAADALAKNPKLDVDVKNKVIADAVAYAQEHGAETIKALGLDPQSGAAVEAIKARIATAITDPSMPTPAILNPQPLAPK